MSKRYGLLLLLALAVAAQYACSPLAAGVAGAAGGAALEHKHDKNKDGD